MKKTLLLLLVLAIVTPFVAYWYLNLQSGPTVSISRLYNLNIQAGQTILVNITVSKVSGMASLRVHLAWDPNVLQVSTGDPNGYMIRPANVIYNLFEGTFLKSFSNSTTFLVNNVDNKAGNITGIFVAIGAQGVTASGSGVLAMINFTCINPGATTIRIIGPREGHSSLQSTTDQIPHEDADGLITNEGSPGVWTESWFQVTVVSSSIEAIILGSIVFVIIRWWRSQAEAANKEEELEKLFES